MTVVEELSFNGRTSTGGMVLEVENLSVAIRRRGGDIPVVNGVSYSVAPGQAVALVGESGAGKSISARAVLGLLDPRRFAVSGRVVLGGKDLATLSARDRRMHVANTASLVFQDPTRSLNPTMRVGWQIAESLHKAKGRAESLSKSDAKDRAIELMQDVGIADPKERFYSFPHELSGGMRQRISIAAAVAGRPKIVFADEPTTSLDVTTQAQIMDLLGDLQVKYQLSFVLVTHDLALAASRVEEVMVMYAGRLVEKMPVSALPSSARMPYTRALLRAVPGALGPGRIPDPIRGRGPDPAQLPSGCAFHPRCDAAQEKCSIESPALEKLDPGHWCACWYPVKSEVLPLGGRHE